MWVKKPIIVRIQGENAREIETTITPMEMGTVNLVSKSGKGIQTGREVYI